MRFTSHASFGPPRLAASALALLLVLFTFASAHAQATLGFRERFTGPHSWAGGAVTTLRPAGGADGESDGFLEVSMPSTGRLATRSYGAEYAGDWIAADIRQVRLWLNDVAGADPLELHVAVGNPLNFWLYTRAFTPPHQAWAEFVADLTDIGSWTQIIGTGTFAQALADVEVLHVRHDRAPFAQSADNMQGDFGLDNILLTNGLVDVGDRPATVRRALELDAPYPNPSRGAVSFAVHQHVSEPLEISILDVTGRRVRVERLAPGGLGPRVWMWDGRDDRGARVAPGAYRVSMRDGSGAVARPLVRIE